MKATRVTLRALLRLLRLALQVLRGLWFVLWRFPRTDLAGRHRLIAGWSAGVLDALGIGLVVDPGPGHAVVGGALIVSNHLSWLDIPVIHAICPDASFVSKATIGRWPLVSRLADAAGTLYLEREKKRDALRVLKVIEAALVDGRRVVVFPEGTTADGRTLLPFHANLLQAAITVGAPLQPIALRYADAGSSISAATEFVGRTTLLQSLWRIATADGLTARLHRLPALSTAGADRRGLAVSLQAELGAVLDAQALP